MRMGRLPFSVLLGFSLFCVAQGPPKGYDGPIPMAGGHQPELWRVGPKPEPARKIDVSQLEAQANEMAKLATGVPPDIDQLRKGLLAKDLESNLKRIEKLSKQLRRELNERTQTSQPQP